MPEPCQCTSCGRRLKVPETLLGKKVKCPGCGNSFLAQAALPDVLPLDELTSVEPPKTAVRPTPTSVKVPARPPAKSGNSLIFVIAGLAAGAFLVFLLVAGAIGGFFYLKSRNSAPVEVVDIRGGDNTSPTASKGPGDQDRKPPIEPDVSRPPEPKDLTPKDPEPAPKEPAAKDPMPKEPEPKEPAPKDPAPKDPMPKEPAAKDPMPKEPAPKDPMPKEPAPKEPPDEVKMPDPKEDVGDPFRFRRGDLKAKAVRDWGGNEFSEGAVAAGLKWIIAHQAPDGHWSFKDFAQHGRCDCKGQSQHDDIAATAFGLLPLLGAGHTHKGNTEYAKNVDRALRYLVMKQKADGEFHPLMYTQALATMAICEAYGMTKDDALRRQAQRAVTYIVLAQSQEGGWRYAKGQTGFDTSVGGWQLQALRTGRAAGLKVPDETLQRCAKWLDAAGRPDGGSYGYTSAGEGLSTSAIGLFGREYLGWGPRNPGIIAGTKRLQAIGPATQNMYFTYYATQVVYHQGGPVWEAWNPRMRDGIISVQDRSDTHQKGSWNSIGTQGGRLMETSLSVLTLEIYYRFPRVMTEKDAAPAVAGGPEKEPAKEPGKEPADPPVMPKPQAPARAAVPKDADLAKAEKEIRELFKTEYAGRRTTDRLTLSKKLLDQAQDTKNDPASQFVLFRESRDLAANAGNLNQAWQAVDEMAKIFDVSAPAQKASALQTVAGKIASATDNESVASAALPLAEEAVALDDFDTAESVLKAAETAARKAKSIPLRTSITAMTKDLEALRKEYARVKKAEEVLDKNPKDADANLTMGKYLCFVKGEWDAGLRLLKRGSDDKLKDLATKDIAEPPDAAEKIALADAWYDQAGEADALSKKQLQRRALYWYQQAVPQATGLVKAKAEKRVEELDKATESAAPSGGWIVIFRSADPNFWGKNARNKLGFGVSLDTAPKDIQFLRLTNMSTKDFVIIKMTKDRLDQASEDAGIGWQGDNVNRSQAFHLGIYNRSQRTDTKGAITVSTGPFESFKGWGFGHQFRTNQRQGYTWAGNELPPTVFEIAVKPGKLSPAENKKLLVGEGKPRR